MASSTNWAAGLAAALTLATACSGVGGDGHLARIHGIRMYYETHGHGPPLLLLHGGCGNGMQFSKQVPAFQSSHRLIVPDCCAQGRSTDRPAPLTYHAMAEDMIALLDKLNVRRVDIMGWSDGGDIGLDLAIHHPDRVNHLVTFGANFMPEGLNPQDVEWNNTATAESFGPGMKEDWTRLNPEPAHYEQAMNKIIAMWRTQPNFSLAQLHSIRAKCLICAGDHDRIRPDHTEQLAHAIPGAQQMIVANASNSALIEH